MRLVSWRAAANVAVAIVVAALVFCLPPIPEDPAYHAFVDTRALFGVKNFWNVVSNAPFVAVGAAGMALVWRRRDRRALRPYAAVFLGIVLTGFGSALYHWAPDNRSLVWDRLPMTLIFTSLYAAVIAERASAKWGLRLLPALVVLGVASVLYWRATEIAGRGDLRPYAIVQFYPYVGILVILGTYPPRYTRSGDIIGVGATYGLAKVFELGDGLVYRLTDRWLSGHTAKHVVAAAATYLIWRNVRDRAPIEDVWWRDPLDAAPRARH
jgi:hypothetical protein